MRKIPYLHLLLFCLTFLTTLAAGALQKGINIIAEPWRTGEGLPFAGTLMTILLFHEFSHYLTSRKHHTRATLPYFIPAPSIIGTFGAFIRMESPIFTRSALIDIGASGPVMGFIISVIACIIGLSMSDVVSVTPSMEGLSLGDSLLFTFLSRMIIGATPVNHDILLHPVAFAGWIGLFVTSLNLLPIGQLDGGHVTYAMLGDRHRTVSKLIVGILAVLGIFFWVGWLVWAVLMLILGIKHPPVLYWEAPLDPARRMVGILSLVIFIITFTPAPFIMMD
ncbi:MAG: site-2 protease family protein [Thermodesulfovibrionales bacterium]|jgi:membrane-associated protease RseP (regulator of RpoE activity)